MRCPVSSPRRPSLPASFQIQIKIYVAVFLLSLKYGVVCFNHPRQSVFTNNLLLFLSVYVVGRIELLMLLNRSWFRLCNRGLSTRNKSRDHFFLRPLLSRNTFAKTKKSLCVSRPRRQATNLYWQLGRKTISFVLLPLVFCARYFSANECFAGMHVRYSPLPR